MGISAKEAAKLAGVSKQSICRACQRDKLSATRGLHNEWVIDPAELERVYNIKLSTSVTSVTESDGEGVTHQSEVLEQRVKFLEEKLRDRETALDDLRTERDDWKAQAQELAKTTKLLTDKQHQAPAPRPNWWQRLWGQ